MDRTPRPLIAVVLAAALFGLLGCERTPEWPTRTEWKTYTHPTLHYTIDVPAECRVQEHRQDALFRYQGSPILVVNFVTPEEGRSRGLWAGHEPVGEIELAGRKGHVYRYKHGDGPMWMYVISYVIPYQERELGVEFRMKGANLGDVQKHVLESFRLPG